MDDQIKLDVEFDNEEIKNLIIEGSKNYALKKYDQASENFSEACEIHAKTYGEDNPTLLFLYGRSMFQIGVGKSEVFGGSRDSDTNPPKKESSPKESGNQDSNFQLADDVEEDDDDDDDDDQEQEEEQSDFEIAWDTLDSARYLFLSAIEKLREDEKNNMDEINNLEIKLAETFDILGEVSLESENFEQASKDFYDSLQLKKKIYPITSPLISEAHFKLSLAYEFLPEESSKQKAIDQMELAIESVNKRLEASNTTDPSLIKDLETRLEDLKKTEAESKALEKQKSDVLLGLMGEEASGDIKDKLASVLGGDVKDISSLIKKKKPQAAGSSSTHSKRKAEDEGINEEDLKKQKN